MDHMKSSYICLFFDRCKSGDSDSLRTGLLGIQAPMEQEIFSTPELSSLAMAPTTPTVQCTLLHFLGGKGAGAWS